MPVHHLTAELSPPIEIEAEDIIQNHSRSVIEIVHTDHVADPARLRLPPQLGAIQMEGAATIRARSLARVGSSEMHIIRCL